GFCSPPPLPPLVPFSPVAAPLSPVTAPALVPFTLSLTPLVVPLSLTLPPSPFSPSPTRRSPLSPSLTRRSPLPLAAPLSPLAVADSLFPSPSRYPSLPSRHRRLIISLFLSLPPSGSPLPVCRPWLPATSIAVAHPPTLASLLFLANFICQVSRSLFSILLSFLSFLLGIILQCSLFFGGVCSFDDFLGKFGFESYLHLELDNSPSFGRKTALKLLRKHGSLENLLQAATIRIVGKQYAQDALTKHADYLRKNYEVLSLRRDVNVHLEEKWLSERDTSNDSAVLSNFMKEVGQSQKLSYRNASISG
ncbi:hypothetical protein ACLOJK_038910, partial [Asimina triloba]